MCLNKIVIVVHVGVVVLTVVRVSGRDDREREIWEMGRDIVSSDRKNCLSCYPISYVVKHSVNKC